MKLYRLSLFIATTNENDKHRLSILGPYGQPFFWYYRQNPIIWDAHVPTLPQEKEELKKE